MLRAAIVGCGRIAGDWDRVETSVRPLTHAGAYRAHPDVEIVAVTDRDPARAREFARRWGVPAWYSELSDLLDREAPDVLSLCQPPEARPDAFLAACRARVPAVFCEKPVAATLEDAVRMRGAAAGVLVAVNFLRRWNPGLRQLRQEVVAGRFGRPVRGIVRYTKGLLGNGSHMIDLARWFFGEPEKVELIAPVTSGDDQGADFRLTFENGLEIMFQHIPGVSYVFIDVDVVCTEGRFVVEQRGQLVRRFHTATDPVYPFEVTVPDGADPTDWDLCLTNAVADLVGCLRSGATPQCRLEDGVRAMEISDELMALRGRVAQ